MKSEKAKMMYFVLTHTHMFFDLLEKLEPVYENEDKQIKCKNLDINKLNNLSLEKVNKKKFPLVNILKNIPAGRFGEPDEVASLVEFLISDNGRYINGQSIIIDGAMSKII